MPNNYGRSEAERVPIQSTEPSRWQSEFLSYFRNLHGFMLPAVNQSGFNRLTYVDFMHQVIPGEILRQSLQHASCFFFDTWCTHAMNIVADSRNGQSIPKTQAEASPTNSSWCQFTLFGGSSLPVLLRYAPLNLALAKSDFFCQLMAEDCLPEILRFRPTFYPTKRPLNCTLPRSQCSSQVARTAVCWFRPDRRNGRRASFLLSH